ncbi:MAG: hypothetical protein ACFCVG_19415 [Kineosporiaceae bacterium]
MLIVSLLLGALDGFDMTGLAILSIGLTSFTVLLISSRKYFGEMLYWTRYHLGSANVRLPLASEILKDQLTVVNLPNMSWSQVYARVVEYYLERKMEYPLSQINFDILENVDLEEVERSSPAAAAWSRTHWPVMTAGTGRQAARPAVAPPEAAP